MYFDLEGYVGQNVIVVWFDVFEFLVRLILV